MKIISKLEKYPYAVYAVFAVFLVFLVIFVFLVFLVFINNRWIDKNAIFGKNSKLINLIKEKDYRLTFATARGEVSMTVSVR